jgi:hypothetical protein
MKEIETKLLNYEIEKADKNYILNLVNHIKSVLRLQSELPQEQFLNNGYSGIYSETEIKSLLTALSDNPQIADNKESLASLQQHYKVATDLAEIADTFGKLNAQINNYLKAVYFMACADAVELRSGIGKFCTPGLKSEHIFTEFPPEQLSNIKNTDTINS